VIGQFLQLQSLTTTLL